MLRICQENKVSWLVVLLGVYSVFMRGISAMNKKALAYFQSGGPTTVINSSLYGVIAEAFKHPEIGGVYGSLYGVEGLIDDNLVDLRKEDLEQIELLKQTPGAALGSSRKKLPGVQDPLFAKIIDTIERRDIGYLLVNGGNDTMDTCYRLDNFFKDQNMDVKVIGIPKTIDNDLMATDHCPGYASAARHVLNFVKMAVVDGKAYRRGKIVLVEIMGRNAGWLTASADLLAEDERPDLIYLPESPFSLEGFLKDVKEVYDRKGYAVVVLSEGLDLPRKNAGGTDSFGHSSLEGVSIHLAEAIKEKLGIGVRSMELSLPQRADPILASKIDIEEAILLGKEAVKALLAGESGKMVAIRRLSSDPYRREFFLAPVGEVANAEKFFPREWILSSSRLSDEFRDYLRPLVMTATHVQYDDDGVFLSAKLRLEKVR